jgi:hypothetical protein
MMPFPDHDIWVLVDLPVLWVYRERIKKNDTTRFRLMLKSLSQKRRNTSQRSRIACKPRHAGGHAASGDDYPDFTENAQGGLINGL